MPVSGVSETPAPYVADAELTGRRAARGALLRVSSFGVGGLIGLITAPLLIGALGVAGYGRYATIVTLLALTAGLTEAGLGPVGVREFTALAGADRERFMRNLLGLRLALTSAGGVIAALFAAAVGYAPEQTWGAAVGAIGLVLHTSWATLSTPLHAHLRLGRQVATELVNHLLGLALVVGLVLGGAGLVPFLAVPVPTGLVAVLLTARLVRGDVPPWPAFELRHWGTVLRQTLPVGAAVAAQTLYFRCVLITVSLTASQLETGYFATADRIVEILIAVPVLVVGTAFPLLTRAAQDDAARLARAVRQLYGTAFALGGGLALVTAVGAPVAMDLLGGRETRPAVPVLRIEALTLLMAFVTAAPGFALLALRRHRALVLANLGALTFTLGLALWLVPPHGARGGAIAVTAGETAIAAICSVVLLRDLPAARPDPRHALRVVCALCLAGAVTLVPGLSDEACLVAVTAAYVLLLAVLRAGPPGLRDAFGHGRG